MKSTTALLSTLLLADARRSDDAMPSSGTSRVQTQWTKGYVLEDDGVTNADAFSFNGRGPTTFALSDILDMDVGIYLSERVGFYNENERVFEIARVGLPTDIDAAYGSGFPIDVVMAGDDRTTGDLLFVSQRVEANSNGISPASSVFLFKGSNSQWTATQQLVAEGSQQFYSNFAASIDVDRTGLDNLVVGCDNCNVTGASMGQLYVFTNTSVSADTWTVQQMLTAQIEDEVANQVFYLGLESGVDDNIIVGAGLTPQGSPGGAALIYEYIRKSWTETQRVDYPFEIVEIDVYDDTIVLGVAETVNSIPFGGAVHVLQSKSKKPKPKSKPKPKQWSTVQVLYPNDLVVDTENNFGYDIAISGDNMLIGESGRNGGAGVVYVYQREEGQWSQHAALEDTSLASLSNNDLWGNLGIIGGLNGPISTATTVSDTDLWDCLVVTIEDQFGDGWDNAYLVITAPDGSQDHVAPNCNFPDEFSFRYCPSFASNAGRYTFSIAEASSSAFFWEIQWRVYMEASGYYFTANSATELTFEWDDLDLQMTGVDQVNVLANNITCVECKPKPKPKPKGKGKGKGKSGKYSRALRNRGKGGKMTQSPTVSPAPTLAVSDVTDWRYIQLFSTGEDWFNENHYGTNFYISDTNGRRLYHTGTMCEDVMEFQCWAGVKDGEYILRVSGDLNDNSGDHYWEYCGRRGGAQEQLYFRVEEGECIPLAQMSKAQYCNDVLDESVMLMGEMVLLGVSGVTKLSDLSAADVDVVTHALAMATGVFSPSDFRVTGLALNDERQVVVSFTLTADSDKLNLDVRTGSSIRKSLNTMSSLLESEKVAQAMKSTDVVGSTAFASMYGAKTQNLAMGGIQFHETEEVTETEVVTDSLTETLHRNEPLHEFAMSGYVLGAVAFLAVAGVVAHQVSSRRSDSAADEVETVEEKSILMEKVESTKKTKVKKTAETTSFLGRSGTDEDFAEGSPYFK